MTPSANFVVGDSPLGGEFSEVAGTYSEVFASHLALESSFFHILLLLIAPLTLGVEEGAVLDAHLHFIHFVTCFVSPVSIRSLSPFLIEHKKSIAHVLIKVNKLF